ncbi:MAG: polysaccharide export protein [Pseudomonadota bacterium]|nr:polysaccharide export protein [Pseudomonadota bacterium]
MLRAKIAGRLVPLVLLLSSCATTPLENPVAKVGSGSEYHLGGGDDLHILIYGEDKLSGEYHVSSLGTVSLPMVGQIKAAGLTIPELEAALVAAYQGAGILTKANISVDLLAYRPFFILGEVNAPGQYPFVPNMNIQQAIATAKGYTYRAKHNVVFVTQWGGTNEVAFRLSAGSAVAPGDTIRIPERHF